MRTQWHFEKVAISKFRAISIILIAVLLFFTVGAVAFFTDLETSHMTFTTASFSKDDYMLKTVHPDGPFAADEDVVVEIAETNENKRDVTSIISMTATWASPDPDCTIFGDKNEIFIAVGDTAIAINDDDISADKKSVSFDLPTQLLTKEGGSTTRQLTVHIPDSLMGTGSLSFRYDKAVVQFAGGGFSQKYSNADLNATDAHDFSVPVGWAASEDTSTDNGKTLMGYLKNVDTEGEYELYFDFPFVNAPKGNMKGFSANNPAPWSHYKGDVTKIDFTKVEDSLISLGSYAFSDFKKITSMEIPGSVTKLGEKFAAGCTTLQTIEFLHDTDTVITFPEAGSKFGAFYLSDYLETDLIFNGNVSAQKYDWVTDNRSKELSSIEVTTQPDKTAYYPGDDFDDTGMVVTAVYTNGSTKVITDYVVADSTELKGGTDKLIITYEEDGVTKETTVAITVKNPLESISIDTPPHKTQYDYGEDFETDGMVVTAHYANGTSKTLDSNDYEIIGGKNLTGSTTYITVSYTEDKITKVDTQLITVIEDPILAANSTWFSQGSPKDADGSAITRASIKEITIVNKLSDLDLGPRTIVDQWDASIYNTGMDSGAVTAYVLSDNTLVIAGNGTSKVYANADSSFVFCDSEKKDLFSSLTNVKGAELFDTSNATTMLGIFYQADALQEVNVSNWDVDSVTNLRSAFSGCSALKSLAVDEWNVSNLEDAYCMFYGCTGLEILNISNWDISSCTNMSGMFYECAALKTLNVSNWKTSSCANMSYMFYRCATLTTIGDTANWNTAEVTNMRDMFNGCAALQELETKNWSTAKVTTMKNMFAYCGVLTTIGDTTNWNTAEVTNMEYMFHGCTALQTLETKNWNTAKVTTMRNMFCNCKTLTTIGNTANWNTAKVANMAYMFNNCNALQELETKNWITANVTNMSNMFYSCKVLGSVNTTNWNTAEVTNMSNMFHGCSILQELETKNWDTAKVTTMTGMFSNCGVLTTIGDTTNWNTAEVTNMAYMFNNCLALQELQTKNWNTAKVTTMIGMFTDCKALTNLDLDKWDTSSVLAYAKMFKGCSNLTKLDLSTFNTSKVEGYFDDIGTSRMASMFSGMTKLQEITLGANFNFAGKNYTEAEDLAILPTPSASYIPGATGNWYRTSDWAKFAPADVPNNETATYVAVPQAKTLMLAPSTTWYQGSADRSEITSITFTTDGTVPFSSQSWDASALQDGSVMAYLAGTDLHIVSDAGVIYANPDSEAAFSDFSNVSTVNEMNHLNTSYVLDMSFMFADMTSITYLDLSNFNTAKVTDMSGMFEDCSDISYMDMSTFSTAKLMTADDVFAGCDRLKSIVIGSGVTNFKVFKLRYLDALTEITFMHDSDDTVQLPEPGEENGAYYVSSYVPTTIYSEHTDIRNYDWEADQRDITIRSFPAMLLPGSTWYKGTTVKSDITEIKVIGDQKDVPYGWTESWNADIGNTGKIKGYVNGTTVYIAGDGAATILANPSSNGMFFGFSAVASITGLSLLDTSDVLTMHTMFYNCYALTELDISSWNTDNVITMAYMFSNCEALHSLDSNFNTEKVTSLRQMFANCYVLQELDTTNWNISKVSDMSYIFYCCRALTNIGDTSNWNTGNVNTMRNMFTNCNVLWELDTANWNTTNVTNMAEMFSGCNALTSVNTTGWDTAKVRSMSHMFDGCTVLTTVGDTTNWNTGNVTTMFAMFNRCAALQELETKNWNIGNVTTLGNMFKGCAALTTIGDTTNWNTGSVTTMQQMFSNCIKLASVNTTNWNTGKVENMTSMFYSCDALTTIGDTTNWNTENVTTMGTMFYSCDVLGSLETKNWNTDKVTSMAYMFNGCNALTTIGDTTNWNTANVTSMRQMFGNCWALEKLETKNWNKGPDAKVNNLYMMFYECRVLTSIGDTTNWNTSNVTTMQEMFLGCKKLGSIKTTNWNTSKVENMNAMFYNCNALTTIGDTTNWNTVNVTTMISMFYNCKLLTSLETKNWNTAKVTSMANMFNSCATLTTLDLSNFNTSSIISSEGLNKFASNCNAATTIILGENFGQIFEDGTTNVPTSGSAGGMFYTNLTGGIKTVVTGTASNAMTDYVWNDDRRTLVETYDFDFNTTSGSVGGIVETE